MTHLGEFRVSGRDPRVAGPSRLPPRGPLANLTRKPLRSPQWHIPKSARPDRESTTLVRSSWTIQRAAPFLDNVVFLTDGRAVSAAECASIWGVHELDVYAQGRN